MYTYFSFMIAIVSGIKEYAEQGKTENNGKSRYTSMTNEKWKAKRQHIEVLER
jgi:hypothetical protein